MMSRTLLKTGIGLALRATSGDRLIGALSGVTRLPLVVGYHRVVDRMPAARPAVIEPMFASRQMFERQLDWIGQRYRFVSLDELGARLESVERCEEPIASVTFDDGYRDVYEHAFPVLMRKGIPAAVFVVTDWLEAGDLLPHDRLYFLLARSWPRSRDVLARLGVVRPRWEGPKSPFEALRLLLTGRAQEELGRVIAALEEQATLENAEVESVQPLTWEMVDRMHKAGVTIGSHTRSHAVLTQEARPRQLDELTSSRHVLEQRLGTRIEHLAYPDGAFDTQVVSAAATAGYRFAYTTCRHRHTTRPLLTIPRRILWENTCLDAGGRFSGAVMSCVTRGVFDLAGCPRTH
jgi:peptidoglycan/xylan/chitin deacetylase (PgdA/CDA1 family)